jgi:hypothetical protein
MILKIKKTFVTQKKLNLSPQRLMKKV